MGCRLFANFLKIRGQRVSSTKEYAGIVLRMLDRVYLTRSLDDSVKLAVHTHVRHLNVRTF